MHPGDIQVSPQSVDDSYFALTTAQFATAVGELPSWCPLSSLYNLLVFSAEGRHRTSLESHDQFI